MFLTHRIFLTVALSTVLATVLTGCGDRSGRVAIDGTVKFKDGQPIDQGSISFSPAEIGTKFTSGAVIIDGRYQIPREKGLGEGRYVVRIYSAAKTEAPLGPPGALGMPMPKERVSPPFNTQSQLTAQVRGGEDQHFDFEVE